MEDDKTKEEIIRENEELYQEDIKPEIDFLEEKGVLDEDTREWFNDLPQKPEKGE